MEDWYSVAMTDLREVGFPQTCTKVKLVQLLSAKYPQHSWEKAHLFRGRYAQQKRLERLLTSLFPVSFHSTPALHYLRDHAHSSLSLQGVEIKINVRKDANLINPDTGTYLELDVFVPSLKLGIEYQVYSH